MSKYLLCFQLNSFGLFAHYTLLLDWLYNTESQRADIQITVGWPQGLWESLFEPLKVAPGFVPAHVLPIYWSIAQYKDPNCGLNTDSQLMAKIPTLDLLPEKKGYFFCDPSLYVHADYPELRRRWNVMARKYVAPNARILGATEAFYNQNMKGSEVIGIHLRGPIHYGLNVPISEYVSSIILSIRPIFEARPNFKVFIASDIEEFIAEMSKLVPVCSYPQKRLGASMTHEDDWHAKGNTLEYEFKHALIDMILLSKCDLLLGGSSNVFLSASIYNPAAQVELIPYLKDFIGN